MIGRLFPLALMLASPAVALPIAKPVQAVSWFTADDYPAGAIRQRFEGTVRYRLIVSTDGRAHRCRIVATSGHASLDQQTCALLLKRAKLEPARNEGGQPVESEYVGSARWQLPAAAVLLPAPFRAFLIEMIDGRPRCSVDWDGILRLMSSRACRDLVMKLPPTLSFPARLRVSATPHELGLE